MLIGIPKGNTFIQFNCSHLFTGNAITIIGNSFDMTACHGIIPNIVTAMKKTHDIVFHSYFQLFIGSSYSNYSHHRIY